MKIQIDGISIDFEKQQQSPLADVAWSVLPHFLAYLGARSPAAADAKQEPSATNGAPKGPSVSPASA